MHAAAPAPTPAAIRLRDRTVSLNRSAYVLHVHIPKAYGTTFRLQSASFLGRSDCHANGRQSLRPPDATCEFYSSECTFSLFAEAQLRPPKAFAIVVVRAPIQHYMSVVRHNRRTWLTSKCDSHNATLFKALWGHPTSWLGWVGAVRRNSCISLHDPRNMQTRHLGPTLSSALAVLDRSDSQVVIAEFTEASFCLLAHLSGTRRAKLCGSAMVKAIPAANNRVAVPEAATDPLDGSLTETQEKEITALLTDDFVLYGAAMRQFAEDIEVVDRQQGSGSGSGLLGRVWENGMALRSYERWTPLAIR